MKKTPAILAAAILTAAASPAFAADTGSEAKGGTTRHFAVGLDVVQLLDNGQFGRFAPNDVTLNLRFQGYLTRNSAWTAAYAWDDVSSIPEVTYKVYGSGYQSGSFWQIGATSVDIERTSYDGDVALLGAFGYESRPAENLVIGASVKTLVGIDHPDTGDKDLIFLPSLTVMFTF